MPYQFPSDVQDKISARMARGEYQSEDDVLRSALQALEDSESDLEAIQAAVDAWRAGDEGMPLSDAFRAVRNSTVAKPSA